jgi:hypothetical protein
MKFTTKVLSGLGILVLAGSLSSNIMFKREYDSIDKSDLYWTFTKVLEKPFKHLVINGGNETHIAFEQSAKSSVRLLQDWVKYHDGRINAQVSHDTLFIDFDYHPGNLFEKFWTQNTTPVRIFSPELLSVNGYNTNFEMFRLHQKTIAVHITGKSKFEVESNIKELDSISVYQRDSSEVVFEMSPEYDTTESTDPNRIGFSATNVTQTNRNESMTIKNVTADVGGQSLLDIGHAQVPSLQLHIEDSSGIILSGGALKKINTATIAGTGR